VDPSNVAAHGVRTSARVQSGKWRAIKNRSASFHDSSVSYFAGAGLAVRRDACRRWHERPWVAWSSGVTLPQLRQA